MPGQRAPGQKLISVPMQEDFIEHIREALPVVGYSDRSSFIRDAIVEKLIRDGYESELKLALAPSRAGKGGRPSHAKYPAHRPGGVELNEKKRKAEP